MGNQPMTIGLRVDRPPKGEQDFKAGSIVYGRVYLSVSRQPQPARSVLLRLVGKETLVVHHTTTTQGERTDHHRDVGGGTAQQHRSTMVREDHYDNSTHNIFEMEYSLRDFPDGRIPVGQYEFPFAMQLPETLPSSMSCRKGQSTCEVKFELVAEVYQQPDSVFRSNPNAKEELIVAASDHFSGRRQHDTSLHLPVDVVPIVRCCCFPKGTIALETKFDKTTVGVQQDGIQVGFRCQNRSTVKVHTVRVKLREVVEWTVQGRKEEVATTLEEINLDAYQYPELERLRRKPRRHSDHYGPVESLTMLDQEPWHDVRPIVVPRRAKDSYQGRGIQVRHILSVELLTEGCCTSNPDATTLIQIFRKLTPPSGDAGSPYDRLDAQDGSCHRPSAPSEEGDDPFTAPPTAPSEFYDEFVADPAHHHPQTSAYYAAVSSASASPYYYDEGGAAVTMMVEAQALPPDWNAQTAALVTIPMAEAIVLGVESSPPPRPAPSSAPNRK